MDDTDKSLAGPKVVSGWVCLSIGAGFIAALAGLVVLVRVLAGS